MASKNKSIRNLLVTLAVVMTLTSCAEGELLSSFFKNPNWGAKQTQGTYKIGNPYKVDGVWYYPEENFHLVETGLASWYGPGFHAESTANGERFDQHQLTAAHRTLQMPSFVKVTNLENGRSAVVKVNDRGPFKSGRVMDVSKRAAQVLGFANQGTARIRLEVIGDESRAIAEAAKRGENTTKMSYEFVHEQLQKNNKDYSTSVAKNKEEERVAEASVPNNENEVPESLMTPTITVEALKDDSNPVNKITYKDNPGAQMPNNNRPKPVIGSSKPSPVVETAVKGKKGAKPVAVASKSKASTAGHETVYKTSLFVQAGSFTVEANAKGLANKLSSIAPAAIEKLTVKGHNMYRVKLGPIATVEEADKVLAGVIHEGMASAMIIGKGKTK